MASGVRRFSRQALGKVETYLADNSGAVRDELTRIKGEIDSFEAYLAPDTCRTPEEAAYIEVLLGHTDSLSDAIVEETWHRLDVFDEARLAGLDKVMSTAARGTLNLIAPPTLRGQWFHSTAPAFGASTAGLVATWRAALETGNPDGIWALFLTWVVGLSFVATLAEHFWEVAPPTLKPDGLSGERTPTAVATPRPPPTATAQHPLVAEFGCQCIIDTYRPFTMLGRELAILNLANAVTAKRLEQGSFSLVRTGDAAPALRECERRG